MKKGVRMMLACVLTCVLTACAAVTAPRKHKAERGFEEKVFVDDENCAFTISGIEPDGLFGYTLKAELENKTEETLMFSFDDVSVNGYMCDPFWACSVEPGKKAKSDISFSESDFEELEIEEVEEIEFTLTVYDENDWSAPDYVQQTFTFRPEE